MLKINTLWKKVLASLCLSVGIFVVMGIVQPTKTSALGCYPNATAAYYNAVVMVKVLNPDGSFNKWSRDFSFKVDAADPQPYGNRWHVPNNGITWPGRGGFPTSSATFSAAAGGAGTEQCTALDGRTATSFIFGDSTDGKPYLACNWGSWGGGSGNEHGLAFFFTPIAVGDAGGAGYWVPGANGYVEPGGLRDANNQQAIITFQFQLTDWSGTNEAPAGRIDELNCGALELNGWAFDPNSRGSLIRVDFYNGRLGVGYGLGSVMTDRQPGGGEPLPANSRFGYDIRRNLELFTGQHDIYAYAIDAQDPGVHTELTWSVNGQNHYTLNYSARCGALPSNTSKLSPQSGVQLVDAANNDNKEEPARAILSTQSMISWGASFTNTITREYYYTRAAAPTVPIYITGIGPNPTTSTVSGGGPRDERIVNNPVGTLGLQAGDRICARTTVSPQHVSINILGQLQVLSPDPPGGNVNERCEVIANTPYISVYNSDIKAGGTFNTITSTCDRSPASKILLNRNSSTWFAAFALDVISPGTDFKTIANRTTGPGPAPDGLKLPNFNNYSACMHDYYGDLDVSNAQTGLTEADINARLANGSLDGNIVFTGNLNFGPDSSDPNPVKIIPNGRHIRLYVDGNVTIRGSKILLSLGPWSSIAAIPSLTIISKGNIYIEPTVLTIAGTYIAQPRSAATIATTGIIDTCYKAGTPITITNTYNECSRPLTVEGGVVAQRVKLNRSFGSSRNASGDQSGTARVCAGASTASFGSVCAAELFIYHPAYYLSQTPDDFTSSGHYDDQYDSVSTLPPLL